MRLFRLIRLFRIQPIRHLRQYVLDILAQLKASQSKPAYAAFGIGKPMPSPELCRGAARGARFLLTCRSSARHIIVSPSWSSLRGGNRRPAHTLMLPTRASLRTKAIALLVSTGAAGRKRARLQPCKTMPSRIGRKSVVVRVITSPFGIVRNSAYTAKPVAADAALSSHPRHRLSPHR